MESTTGLSWMAWTWETAAFFIAIALMLAAMTIWELLSPGGGLDLQVRTVHATTASARVPGSARRRARRRRDCIP